MKIEIQTKGESVQIKSKLIYNDASALAFVMTSAAFKSCLFGHDSIGHSALIENARSRFTVRS